MPNFIPICPAACISIENKQTHKQTNIAIYILDCIDKKMKKQKMAVFAPFLEHDEDLKTA